MAISIETANVTLDEYDTHRHAEVTPGAYVLLTMSDTGIGMTEEVQEHLFEPFFTTKEVGKGTGLGLATCFGIITQSGGYIRVDSQPEQGTTFKIYLPRVAGEEARPLAEQSTPTNLSRGTETILLAEDEPAVRDHAARVLREQGYTVR